MKKLLSLLSVLTISGTVVPTTIAASPYQKEENNRLNRIKRDDFFTNPDVVGPTSLEQIIINTNFSKIEDNTDDLIFNKIKELNPKINNFNGLYIRNKNNLSCEIVAGSSSEYKYNSYVVIKYILNRDLINLSSLLTDWERLNEKAQNNIKRQLKEDVPNFSEAHKRSWKDDKKLQLDTIHYSLKQTLAIILNNEYIKKIYSRIENLENELTLLKNKVDGNILDSDSCSKPFEFVSTVSSLVSLIDKITSGISSLMTISCSLATI